MKISVKYNVIYRHKYKYAISEMCRFFNVSRSGYYDFVKRINISAKDLKLADKIAECQQECNKTYGYRRVWLWLERKGIHYNPKTVLRVMQKYSLLSVIRRKKYRNYSKYLHSRNTAVILSTSEPTPNRSRTKPLFQMMNLTG